MKGSATKRIIHDALILTVFTLVLGFILGAVHEITKTILYVPKSLNSLINKGVDHDDTV